MSAYGSIVSDVMVKGGTRCRLDTVTYTSPEFDELETLVEVCEPLCETEEPTMQAPWNRAQSRSFSSLPNSTKSKRLCKHPVSEQRFRMGGRSLHSPAPASAPPLGFSASRSYGLFPAFRAEYPSGTRCRAPRRATPNEGNDHDRQTTGCKSP